MSELPHSFYKTSLLDRLKIIGETPPGTPHDALPDWLGTENWFEVIQQTCRDAAQHITAMRSKCSPS